MARSDQGPLAVEEQSFAGSDLDRGGMERKAAGWQAQVCADADFCFAAGRKLAIDDQAPASSSGATVADDAKLTQLVWMTTAELGRRGLALQAGGTSCDLLVAGIPGAPGESQEQHQEGPAGGAVAAAPVYVLGRCRGRWKCVVDVSPLNLLPLNQPATAAAGGTVAAAAGSGDGDGGGAAWAFEDLRALMPLLSRKELAIAGQAVALSCWHANHRFCGACGSPTEPIEGGAKRGCSTNPRHRAYPRVDPVVIALVENLGGTHALLGRSRGMRPGMYTCLSGFLEQGESIEDAVRREVAEESGVEVGRVDVVASQPWPIGRGGSHELMIGALAQATDDAVCVNLQEMEDVRWVPREALAQAFALHSPSPPAAASGTGVGTTPAPSSAGAGVPQEAAAAAAGAARGAGEEGGVKRGDPFLHPHSVRLPCGMQFWIPPPIAVAHHLIRLWVVRGGGWFPPARL